MNVTVAVSSDFNHLTNLAREVEDLFGPMADEVSFQTAMKDAILQETVFCVRTAGEEGMTALKGGIAVSNEANAILWFVVSKHFRNQGVGGQLLRHALAQLDPERDIVVQTFEASVQAGMAARKLYLNSGFIDIRDGGKNPAGVPTVIMHLEKPRHRVPPGPAETRR